MKNLKLKLKTKSGFSNLFTADQVWGQMVFAISDLKGEKEASKFVESFDKNPPFLISNMMPENFFPRVILPPFKKDINDNKTVQDEKKNRALAKKSKKNSWVPLEIFLKHQKNINELKLEVIEKKPELLKINEVRSSIDRKKGIPFESTGGVFNQNFIYSNSSFVIYIRLLDESFNSTLYEIVSYLNLVGLGGDRSVGKGNFDIKVEALNEIEENIFSYNQGNAYMSLSRCSGENLIPLYYNIDYYFGIVGSNFDDKKSYNKYPIIYFEPGSIFSKGDGMIIHNVHINPKICSYGYSFPIYLNI